MGGGVSRGPWETGREDFVVVVETDPVLAGGLAHGYQLFYGGTLGLGLVHFFLEGGLVVGHHHLHVGCLETVFQVFGGQHIGGRDGDGANAVQCQEEKPEFVTASEDEHHPVALDDSLFYQEVGRALGG